MPLVVWRFIDGKAGHDHQTQGLTEALARLRPVEAVVLKPLPAIAALKVLPWGRAPPDWLAAPPPDLALGAGHGTHLSLLAARRGCGGKAVVLMRPSLPLGCFDLCLIPEHDSPPARPDVIATRGALNRIRPSSALEANRGLLLIGGPSAHFGWDSAGLYRQIAAILTATPQVQWTLTTSRRTPLDFPQGLPTGSIGRSLTVIPVVETGPDWLPAQLARAGQAWVTADSVAMVHEALTAGAAVGILELPARRSSRVSRGVDRLAVDGWVTTFADWTRRPALHRPPGSFDEAERCARRIVARWFA